MALQDMLQNLMPGKQKIMAMKKPDNNGTPGSFDVDKLLLSDPDKLGIDHDKADWKVSPDEDAEEAIKISKHVRDQFEKAYRTRHEMELEWMQALAFFEGRQWYKINSQARNLASLQDPSEANRYITDTFR